MDKAKLQKKILLIFWLMPGCLAAQDFFYYHTINSSSLAASYGRTYRAQYTYQLSHNRQLKLTGLYILDEYDQGLDRIRSDIYNANLQFQYNVIYLKKVFINLSVGVGGYLLKAEDKLKITHEERKINFVGGLQVEYYLLRNHLALIGDFDVLYMPFSDIYEFLRVPGIGLAIYF